MRTFVCPIDIGFGDCDPAGIVYYPNFFRWFDVATHRMFREVGLDAREIHASTDLVVWPLVDAGAQFRAPVTYGQRIEVHSTIVEWRNKTFRIEHKVFREGELALEGWEIRFVGQRLPDSPYRLRAVPIPEHMKRAFEPAGHAPILLDSIGHIREEGERAAGAIVVSGSHAGTAAADYVLVHPHKPLAVFLNDAGVGCDHAGIAGLPMLDAIGVIAAACSHETARIGEARDVFERGVISHANRSAKLVGIEPGMTVIQAIARLEEERAHPSTE